MQFLTLAAIVGLLGGAAVALQGPLTSLMSQHIGTMESVFIVHIGGAMLSGVFLVVAGGGNLSDWRSVPWYALGAGVLGLVILSAVSYTIPRIGVAATVALIVAGQLILSTLLDHFGLLGTSVRPIDLSRIAGVVVLFLGTWLMIG